MNPLALTLSGIRLCAALHAPDVDTCEDYLYELASNTVILYRQSAFIAFAPTEPVMAGLQCVAWAKVPDGSAFSYFCWKDGPMKFNLNKGRFE